MASLTLSSPRVRRRAFGRPVYMLAALLGLFALYVAILHPWMMNWGATPAEQAMALPGDEFGQDKAFHFTRALTVHATPEQIWPWLMQVGQDRAGFYSYYWLENLFSGGMTRVDELRPAWQSRAVGDRIPLARPDYMGGLPGDVIYAKVTFVEPGHAISLTGHVVLQPIDAATTRMLVREYGGTVGPKSVGEWAGAAFAWLVWDPMHFVMQRQMMRGIAAHAEGHPYPPAWLDLTARFGWWAAGVVLTALCLSRRRWWPALLLPLGLVYLTLWKTGDVEGALAGYLALGITLFGFFALGRRWLAPFTLVATVVLLTLLFAPDAWLAFGLLFLVVLLALAGVKARQSFLLVLVLALCLLAAPTTSYADGATSFAERLDEHMPALLDRYGVPGTVVAYIQSGDVVWTRAYGVANRSTGEPMRPDLLLEHGSNGKAMTAWAVMRLVEQGKVNLDAPANQYLRRWQIPSNEFNANGITVRHLLSHTSGLTIHGFVDYSPRRVSLPSVVETLQGKHLLEGLVERIETGRPSWGEVEIVQPPGLAYKYSGGGYSTLQLIIEDVTGEPFAQFVQREVTDAVGASSVRWAWTPELQARAPVAYSLEQQPLEYRQLAVQSIGSEIATVTDYARFLAAAVEGPNGEPAGRGVLKPGTVDLMLQPQVGANGYGLGYGLGRINNHRVIIHSGANTGWMAYYILDTVTREGFVIASNSSRSGPFHLAVQNDWLDAAYGPGSRPDFPPDPTTDPVSAFFQMPALILGAAWLLSLAWFVFQVRTQRRAWEGRPGWRAFWPALAWLLPVLFVWYWLYSPLPLVLPAAWPDLWPVRAVGYLVGVLLAWTLLSGVIALYPKQRSARQPVLRPVGQPAGS